METNSEKARIGTARNLARDLIKKCKIKEAPVSLQTVINFLKGTHNLEIYPNSNFSDQLSGLLVTVENEFLDERRDEIHFNKNHSWHRRRFTIAHEIGHLLFNSSCASTAPNYYDMGVIFETEANQFAAELLMPLSFLKVDLKKDGAKVDDLAWKYIVSKEAMGWKIAGSNLLR